MLRTLLASSVCLSLSVIACASVEEPVAGDESAVTDTSKRVVVGLAEQRARAYEGDRCVREWPISTGSSGNETWLPFAGAGVTPRLQVDFPILEKREVVMMTDPTGQGRYENEPVNWDVRLTMGGIFFHEANWTNIPGTSTDCGHCGYTANAPAGTSHGCINQRKADAKWFYTWSPAPDRTRNVVHLSFDKLPAEACDVVSEKATAPAPTAPTAKRNVGTDEAKQDTKAGYDECLRTPAYATYCLEDLGASDYICWRNGERSTSGLKTCTDGAWR